MRFDGEAIDGQKGSQVSELDIFVALMVQYDQAAAFLEGLAAEL